MKADAMQFDEVLALLTRVRKVLDTYLFDEAEQLRDDVAIDWNLIPQV